MKSGATIEAQIEAAWLALLDTHQARSFYLTADGKLRHEGGAGRPQGGETYAIGTFTRTVSLADFREEVFFVYADLQGALRGGR